MFVATGGLSFQQESWMLDSCALAFSPLDWVIINLSVVDRRLSSSCRRRTAAEISSARSSDDGLWVSRAAGWPGRYAETRLVIWKVTGSCVARCSGPKCPRAGHQTTVLLLWSHRVCRIMSQSAQQVLLTLLAARCCSRSVKICYIKCEKRKWDFYIKRKKNPLCGKSLRSCWFFIFFFSLSF